MSEDLDVQRKLHEGSALLILSLLLLFQPIPSTTLHTLSVLTFMTNVSDALSLAGSLAKECYFKKASWARKPLDKGASCY